MDGMQEFDSWSVSKPVLYRELRARYQNSEPTVLATIVDVAGSAYRRPGAKMLISPEGESFGAVTAGCLEGPAIELASKVFEDRSARIETFDLTDDDEWGLGLGCNGIIDILMEPLSQSLAVALKRVENRDPIIMVTAIESSDSSISIGDRAVLSKNGERLETVTRKRLPTEVLDDLKPSISDLRDNGTSTPMEISSDEGTGTVFVDYIEPAPQLLLFGNQNDIHSVSRIGREAGFKVTVASARGSRISCDDFPYADKVIGTHPTNLADHTNDKTYVVLMSHNLLDDTLALETLLSDSDVPYVGLMGPRKRFEEIRDDLAENGTTFTDAQLQRVSTPVGLDLGGDEPSQIALSIVSEVLAVSNGRSGGHLEDREGPIHERPQPTIQ